MREGATTSAVSTTSAIHLPVNPPAVPHYQQTVHPAQVNPGTSRMAHGATGMPGVELWLLFYPCGVKSTSCLCSRGPFVAGNFSATRFFLSTLILVHGKDENGSYILAVRLVPGIPL